MTEPNVSPRSSIRTMQFCKRCGKPLGNQGVSSLTGWLFQETFCQCQVQDSVSKGKSSDLQPGSLFGGAPGDKDVFDLPSFGDEYEVLERIGKGGMGCVYKVRDVNLDRFLAVKVLHDQLKDDQQSVSRFEREAKAALKLMHANLVPVFAYDTSPAGAPYLVMDFVDGISLEMKLKQESYLDVSVAIDIFLQICGALTHAHQHGIIHRDLKPGNIIITKDDSGKEVAKLVDFGIAKVRSGSSRETQNLTQTGEVFGSPHYMSPEQCLGFDLDSRSDIYSLGCVMYECLSGKTPFEGHNAVQLVAKHLSSDVPPLRICDNSQSQRINNRLTEIILKCLEKEPSDRYFSAELLAAELKQLTEEVSSSPVSIALPRKLSILRSLFLIFCSASLLSITFVIAPGRKEYLILLPAVAAIIGAVLANGRLSEFVSRTQFQSKVIRESAGSCVNVLVVCHWILATCLISALASPFMRMLPVAYPICSAALGAVIIIAVWSGFLQSVEASDIKGSIQSGKVMNAISIAMLATTVLFISQYYGKPSEGSRLMAAPADASLSIGKILDSADHDAEEELEVDGNTIAVVGSRDINSPAPNRYATIVEREGKKYRVFRIPQNVDLGNFFPLNSYGVNEVNAVGTVEFPITEAIGLRLHPHMTYRYAYLLSRFPPDALQALAIDARIMSNAHLNDSMYFARKWKSLQKLALAGGDLNDEGLLFVKRFDKLTNLSLACSGITAAGVTALPQLGSLHSLMVREISDGHSIINALHRSKNLEFLALEGSDIDDIDLKELSHFPNLMGLRLNASRKITDNGIQDLCTNSKLVTLSLAGASITARSFPSIAKLHHLRSLELSAESSTKEELMTLQRQMPNCEVFMVRH